MAETLTEVLAAHRWTWRVFQGKPEIACSCGAMLAQDHDFTGGVVGLPAHEAHLADAVRAWLLGQRDVAVDALVVAMPEVAGIYDLTDDEDLGIADAVLDALTKADQ